MTDTVDIATVAAEPDAPVADVVAVAPAAIEVPPPMPVPARSSTLGASLAAVPSNTDAFMAHLLRCLQTRAGTDVVLQFLAYSFRLSGSLLDSLSRSALRQSARHLVDMAFRLPPSTSVTLTSATPPPAAALMLKLSARFKALNALLSETRTINRLWGLLGLYFALKRLVVKMTTKKTDAEKADVVEARFDSVVAFAQVLSLIAFQAFENLAYLSGKKVIALKPATQGKFALLSGRCWGTYVFIELGRLLVERSRKTISGEAVKDQAWATNWSKSFLRNLAWAPLTLHWSVPNGPLPDILVGLLAMYPSTGMMVDLWRETTVA